MNKRHFLGAAALIGAGSAMAQPSMARAGGPALLTLTGAIGKTNRGPFDPALDQMMGKQKLHFERAFAFDFAMLASLPAVQIKTILEYDARPAVLRGPLLLDVLAAAGTRPADSATVVLRAVDGYAAAISVEQARRQRFMVATLLDGKAMPLGGLGPLWAVADTQGVPELAAKPLAQRFAGCPWALYHIEVQG